MKYKALLGEDHPSTIKNAGNLAMTYNDQGRYKEAEELQRQVMEKYKAMEKQEYRIEILFSMYNLACSLKPQGKIAEAIDLMEHVVQRSDQVEAGIRESCILTLNEWRSEYKKAI
jgi:tetratricopeptide (TPR) repeat protein